MLSAVRHVYMPVEKIFRPVLIHQFQESFKSLMGKVSSVVDAVRRGVGDKNIESPVPEKFRPQSSDTAPHFPFCILPASGFVSHGAAQSQDPHAFMYIDLIVNADAALRGDPFVFIVMVSMDIKHRYSCKRSKERKIVGIQIPAGNDKIDPLHFAFFKKIDSSSAIASIFIISIYPFIFLCPAGE